MPLKWVPNTAETTLDPMPDILDFVQQCAKFVSICGDVAVIACKLLLAERQ